MRAKKANRATHKKPAAAKSTAHIVPADSSIALPSVVEEAIMRALKEIAERREPRPRMRLRAAMRKLGLDEWKIAWLLNFKIHCLAQSQSSSDAKLLLDYLKEASRHLDPASARNTDGEAPAMEIVHGVPRPEASREPVEN